MNRGGELLVCGGLAVSVGKWLVGYRRPFVLQYHRGSLAEVSGGPAEAWKKTQFPLRLCWRRTARVKDWEYSYCARDKWYFQAAKT